MTEQNDTIEESATTATEPAPVASPDAAPVEAPVAVTLEEAPETEVRPLSQPQEPRNGFYWGTGRRKAAIARVRIRPGSGEFKINGRALDDYFSEIRDQKRSAWPLEMTDTADKMDVFVNAHGGGYAGQAGAVMLGLARALKGYDPTLEPILRENEMLSRDPRRVERKKPGQPGARKRFQFSKR